MTTQTAAKSTLSPMGQAALELSKKGLYLVPLCWPDENNQCACPRKHTKPHDVGKAPITPRGINDSTNEIRQIWDWWVKYPKANIAVDLDRSGLIAIGPDAPEWFDQFQEWGLPDTAVVQSGGGEGHYHYYYRRPADTPLININVANGYDIQPRGYVVGAGSLHASGRYYQWVTDFPWRDVEDLPYAPDWALAWIDEKWAAHIETPEIDPATIARPTDYQAQGATRTWLEGTQYATKADSTEIDTSMTLYIIGGKLVRDGLTDSEIIAILRDTDEALGYRKYSRRRDGGLKAYTDIVATQRRRIDTLAGQESDAGILSGAERTVLEESIKQGKAGLTSDSVLPYGRIKTTTRVNTVTRDPVTGMETWVSESKPRSMLSIYHEQSKEYAARLATGEAKIYTILYKDIPNYGHVDFPLFPMENRNLFPVKEDLVNWLTFADGAWEKSYSIIDAAEGREPKRNPKVLAQEHCLSNGFMACDEHGHRTASLGSCGGKQCPHCGSKRARDIGRVTLPEGNYRIVWHRMEIVLGDQSNTEVWGNVINRSWKVAQKAMGRINTRVKSRKKLNASRLLHRAAGFHMDWPTSTMHIKCTYWEEEPGALDKDIARFEWETGAELLWDSVTDDRTIAQVHMVGAATASLISVDRTSQHSEDIRTHLFAAYWEGTKGEHLNRVLDWLETMITALPEPEKLICDVKDCGKELHWVVDTQAGDQTTNPSHPDYAWRYKPLR